MNIRVVDYQSTSAAGLNIEQLRHAIGTQSSGLRKNDFPHSDLNTWIGKVADLEAIELGKWQSRNNALAALGLQQGSLLQRLEDLKKRFSANRIGVIMGSSTSSIDRTETAYRDLDDNGQLKPEFNRAMFTTRTPQGYLWPITRVSLAQRLLLIPPVHHQRRYLHLAPAGYKAAWSMLC